MNLKLVRLPPLMLDWPGPDYPAREKMPLMGRNLPCYPFKGQNSLLTEWGLISIISVFAGSTDLTAAKRT